MSAENGVPMDNKCPKCSSRIVQGKAGYITVDKYECCSIVDENFVFAQSPTCKRIAELEAENKMKAQLLRDAIELLRMSNMNPLHWLHLENGLGEG